MKDEEQRACCHATLVRGEVGAQNSYNRAKVSIEITSAYASIQLLVFNFTVYFFLTFASDYSSLTGPVAVVALIS